MRHEYYYRGFIIQVEDSLKTFIARVFTDVTEPPIVHLQTESGALSTKPILAQARARVDGLLKAKALKARALAG
jgi:hypothetical protein